MLRLWKRGYWSGCDLFIEYIGTLHVFNVIVWLRMKIQERVLESVDGDF